MKGFFAFLLFMLIGGVIISCSKNSPKGNPAESPLYGSWKSISLVVTGCTDNSLNHNVPDCNIPGALCWGSLNFTSTTMITTSILGTNSSNYTINGNSFNYPSDGGVPTTFTVVDTVLTLTYQQKVSDGNCHIVSTYIKN